MTNEDRERMWAESIASRVVLCPDCEVLCYRPSEAGSLMELPASTPWDQMPDWFQAQLLSHGHGIRLGRDHRCPPTSATLTPVTED